MRKYLLLLVIAFVGSLARAEDTTINLKRYLGNNVYEKIGSLKGSFYLGSDAPAGGYRFKFVRRGYTGIETQIATTSIFTHVHGVAQQYPVTEMTGNILATSDNNHLGEVSYYWKVDVLPVGVNPAPLVSDKLMVNGQQVAGNGVVIDKGPVLIEGFFMAADPGCPPRNLDFNLNLHIVPSTPGGSLVGVYTVKLLIDGGERYSIPYTFDASNVAGFNEMNITIAASDVVTYSGAFNYVWTVNGTTVASGSYQCLDEVPENQVNNAADYTASAETTTTTTSPTTGTTTTTTTNNPPPTPDANPTTTTTTTTALPDPDPSTLNREDVYQAVRQGVLDAARTGTTPGNGGGDEFELEEIDTENDGHADELQDKLEEVGALKSQLTGGWISKVSAVNFNLPTTFGTVPTIDFGVIPVLGTRLEVSMTGPIGGKINLIRTAILWLITIAFCIKSFQALRYYL